MKKFLVVLMLILMMSSVVYGASFSDIEGMHCEIAVENIAFLGIVNGVSENSFAPNKAVTRAELSKMIIGAIGEKNGASSKSFNDITNHWGKDFIQKAANLGILNGYEDGTFRPDREVTYAETIAIMLRTLGYNNLDESKGSMWYDCYVEKMKELNLDEGVLNFSSNAHANRGDVAVLLWNMIKDNSKGKNLLEKNFSKYAYWENVKITEITAYAGRIVYVTKLGNFYMDENISFSDLGAKVSGFFDKANNILHCMTMDEGLNVKKISGSAKTIKEMGYDIFTCDDISGYGEREYAKYIEIFVDKKTNKTVRVVFYDTRESHFAEDVKLGKNKVTIESKDVYDKIIVYEKEQKYEYNIMRTESVKDIKISALVVYKGRVVSWESVPDNSMVREIKKDMIYTYTHEYIDGEMDEVGATLNEIKFDGIVYVVSDECICENVATETSMKLIDGLDSWDLREIAKNDKKLRIYLNEFDEIIKLEFCYDIWKLQKDQEQKEEIKELKPTLDNIGIVTGIYLGDVNDEDERMEHMVSSIPKNVLRGYYSKNIEFALGDFVYFEENDRKEKKDDKKEDKVKLVKLSNSYEIDGLQVVTDYIYPIEKNKIGKYEIDDQTQIYEIKLKRKRGNENEYEKCRMETVMIGDLDYCEEYKNIHLLVDKDGTVVRLYAFKEYGNTFNVGIVKKIVETNKNKDGETPTTSIEVYVTKHNEITAKYRATPVMGYSVGDMVIYEIEKSGNEDTLDTIVVKEVYNHNLIGNSQDLFVKSYKNGIARFGNREETIDFNKDIFIFAGEEYDVLNYTFIEARVERNKESNEWEFKSFGISENPRIIVGSRVAINELSRTVICYTGYSE